MAERVRKTTAITVDSSATAEARRTDDGNCDHRNNDDDDDDDDDENDKRIRPPPRRSAGTEATLSFFVRRWMLWVRRSRLLDSPRRRRALALLLAIMVPWWMLVVLDALFGSWEQVMPAPSALASGSLGSSPSSQQQRYFAVAINTYRRPDRLRSAVLHYAETCGKRYNVGQVVVLWGDTDSPPPQHLLEQYFDDVDYAPDVLSLNRRPNALRNAQRWKNRVAVRIVQLPTSSLNGRFLPIDNLKYDGVFMVDDDVRVDCASLQRGFDAWRTHPEALVGYYPRLASPPRPSWFGGGGSDSSGGDGGGGDENGVTERTKAAKKSNQLLLYHPWPAVHLRNSFNFILTKASFLHRRYFELYSDPDVHPKEILDYIYDKRNCEDVAMALLVANQTSSSFTGSNVNHKDFMKGMSAIYVEGSVSDGGLFGGISTGSGHFDTRNDCLTDLTNVYVRHGWGEPLRGAERPLVGRGGGGDGEEGQKASSASWRRHFPGLWFQARPSNFFEWFAFNNLFS